MCGGWSVRCWREIWSLLLLCACSICLVDNFHKMKKRSERRKHCVLAVVRWSQKNFTPPQTHSQVVRDGQNLISWRWSMHTISSYRVNRPTNTHKPTDRTDYKTLHRSLASVQCNWMLFGYVKLCYVGMKSFGHRSHARIVQSRNK